MKLTLPRLPHTNRLVEEIGLGIWSRASLVQLLPLLSQKNTSRLTEPCGDVDPNHYELGHNDGKAHGGEGHFLPNRA